MLQHSNKPQILRLHELEQKQRNKFSANFNLALTQLLPSSTNRTIKSSLFLMKLLSALPDLYYTLATVYFCKRRLGEEYTYIAMYKKKHFQQEGVLLNKKTRLLLFLLEMVSRNLLVPLFSKFMDASGRAFEKNSPNGHNSRISKFWDKIWKVGQQVKEGVSGYLESAEEIMSNVEWLILMVYMLDWNKHFTFIETLLGISYVYTYKNDQIRDVSYAIEGYLLLATFIVKAAKILYSIFKSRQSTSKKTETVLQGRKDAAQKGESGISKQKEKGLCRICYDDIKCKSSTKCGHVFCWSCIIQSLELSQECPVCRSKCLAREVVQLRNI